MDPEVQKILEELSKITNSQQLENYRKSLIKAGGALEKNSKLSEEEQKEIKRAIEQRKRLFSVSSKLEQNFKNVGQSIGLSEKAATGFAKGTVKTTSFVGKFSKAVSEGTGRIQDYTASLAEFGRVGESLARIGNLFGESTDAFRTLSSVGATFGQNLIQLREASANAGIPITDFVDMIGKNSEALALLFGTTTEGAKQFAGLSKQFRDANISFLAPLGLTVEEINEFLISNLTLQRRTGLLTQQSEAQQLKTARDYIEQLDRLARLTGQQREDLARQMEASLANERFLAMLNTQTPIVAQNLQQFEAGITKLAPGLSTGLQDLIATAGNPVTDAAIEFAQNIPESQQIVKDLIAGNITVEEAMTRMRDAAQRSNKRFNETTATGTVEFLRLQGEVNKLATASLNTADAIGEQQKEADKLTQEFTEFETNLKNLTSAVDSTKTGFLKLVDDFVGTGTGSLNDMLGKLSEDVKKLTPEMAGLLFVMKEGIQTGFGILKDTVPIFLAVKTGTTAGIKAAGGMGGGFMGGGGGKGKAGIFQKGMRFLGRLGMIGAGAFGVNAGMNMAEAGAESDNDVQKGLGIATGAASGALTGAAIGSMVPIIGTALGAALGTAVGGGLAAYEGYGEEIKGFFSNLFGGGDGRAIGTLQSTGGFVEPRNTLAAIHAGERVLSPAEAKNYAEIQKGMATNTITNQTGNVTSSDFTNVLNELKTANKNLNMLVSIGDATRNNTDRTKNLLANKTESLV